MRIIATYNNKKHVATPDDSIYLKHLDLSCHLCIHTGPKKVHRNLWQLTYHFNFHHKNESWKEIESTLYEFIKMGILR